ncbi:hypothetical protein [Carboxylicivirga sp. M1479]|uniref:hypothetical protein n=1 Tax=Carboxylicivirga sp. M1479 TaxID=2594476 RepID=UPI00117818F0|nr:hypothetical protein [Carboxylicivirga sp. M1479]TRX70203.1 hypothetical protein FNN09_12005 [Carboxylicivirga sp. M1479]
MKSINRRTEKPSAEAKALSLYLMAFKSTDSACKEQSKRMKRLWDIVLENDARMKDYVKEVQKLLAVHGGYEKVVEKTVKHFVEKTGEWKLKGDDKFCVDAQRVADDLKKK